LDETHFLYKYGNYPISKEIIVQNEKDKRISFKWNIPKFMAEESELGLMEIPHFPLGDWIHFCKFNFSAKNNSQIMLHLMHGISNLHSHDICHFDLNMSNILVRKHDDQYQGVMIDFAFSQKTSDRLLFDSPVFGGNIIHYPAAMAHIVAKFQRKTIDAKQEKSVQKFIFSSIFRSVKPFIWKNDLFENSSPLEELENIALSFQGSIQLFCFLIDWYSLFINIIFSLQDYSQYQLLESIPFFGVIGEKLFRFQYINEDDVILDFKCLIDSISSLPSLPQDKKRKRGE
jgi:hypothetical protein